MKQSILATVMLLLVALTCSASPKTIVNPNYEFRSTGIYSIRKIQLSDTATYLTIHSDFIPGWWVMFTDDISIRDIDTGNEYKVLDIQGATFNEHLWMPESGDSSVVLVFPPLPATVKKIDYHIYIYGVSLDKSMAGTRANTTVLPEVEKWISDELAKSTREPLKDFQSDDFFSDTPARLIGCIKGYDHRAEFSTGMIYASNVLTREDFPVVAKIQPDGRFEVEIPMVMPQKTMMVINGRWAFPFYMEPGQTMAMILDWEEFLVADRKRNIRYQFNDIEYRGALASLNRELISFPDENYDYDSLMEKVKTLSPMDFKKENEKEFARQLNQLEQHLAEKQLSEKAQNIIRYSAIVENTNSYFNFEMYRGHYARQEPNEILQMPVPDSYYTFIQNIDLNDKNLLVSMNFAEFINRFEYMSPFNKARAASGNNNFKPVKSILDFLTEAGTELSDEEMDFLKLVDKTDKTEADMNTLSSMQDIAEQFNAKYHGMIQKWAEEHIIPFLKQDIVKEEIESWKARDSILDHELGLQSGLIYEIAKIRSLEYLFSRCDTRENAGEFWSFLKQGINTPFLLQTGDRLLNKAFPEVEIASTPLPEGIAADIFKNIIEPHKGKMLIVNFWAITCGPCISGISRSKQLREKYAGNPDFDFVFITDERGSPEDRYKEFVNEQELANVYRLKYDEFNYMRQLFRFNGIPRYVIIDSNGNLVNDNFSMYNFESELAKLLPQYQ